VIVKKRNKKLETVLHLPLAICYSKSRESRKKKSPAEGALEGAPSVFWGDDAEASQACAIWRRSMDAPGKSRFLDWQERPRADDPAALAMRAVSGVGVSPGRTKVLGHDQEEDDEE